MLAIFWGYVLRYIIATICMGSTCMGSALFGRQYFHTASTRSTTVYSLNTPSILLSIYEYDVY